MAFQGDDAGEKEDDEGDEDDDDYEDRFGEKVPEISTQFIVFQLYKCLPNGGTLLVQYHYFYNSISK
jgi:hypothetical protein